MPEENNDEGNDPKEGKERRIRVTVDGATKQIEELQKELQQLKEEKEAEVAEWKKKAEEAEEGSAEAEKYKEIVAELAKKEYEKEKGLLVEAVDNAVENKFLTDERANEFKDILAEAEEKGEGPQRLNEIKFMINSLKEAYQVVGDKMKQDLAEAGITEGDITRGKERLQRTKPRSSGSVSLLSKGVGGDSIWSKEYESAKEFVLDLYTAIREEKDPIKKQKLEDARDELWRKLWQSEVQEYKLHGKFDALSGLGPSEILPERDKHLRRMIEKLTSTKGE